MRTQKRFTPALLERYEYIGRGTGTYQNYIPWHRVGRSDPSSQGRSHLAIWQGRQRELLSDGEWVGLLFSTMLTNIEDFREQQKLTLDDGASELADYDVRHSGQFLPGTRAIAQKLGIKHPRVNGGGRSDDWRMTTDQLIVFRSASGQLEMLAVAYKPDGSALKRRQLQLLSIEKEYWNARGVPWLLITPAMFDARVGLTLRRIAQWGLGTPVSDSAIALAVDTAMSTLGHTFTFVLDSLALQLGGIDIAQRAFWQAVWKGALTMELRIGWRPHLPIQLLSAVEFASLNPVASRRSAWN
jgi:TnsA endonuclease N terminal